MNCSSCGRPLPADARFCPACGQSVLAAGADQRRVVTVLFGDLVGYTALSETLDPEQVKAFVDGCFEQLVADVVAFGGRVDKILGDGLIALFGAPVAHGDDAERAVRAALRMRCTLSSLCGPAGQQVEMRIGVNTGEVLVGALRSGGDYTAMGDVVNTAQRLQAAAAPGSVVVGPETHTATADIIHYESLGRVPVKGREEPVEAWVAVEAVAPPGRRPRRVQAKLVGRELELALVERAIEVAFKRGRAHFVMLEGEAGVGKSRLAEEAVALAEDSAGATLFEGQCVPYGESNVWWPLASALRDTLGVTATSIEVARQQCRDAVAAVVPARWSRADVERVSEGLLALLDITGGTLDAINPARAREEVSRSVLAYLEARAEAKPIVLSIADLHWADPLVLDLLGRALTHLAARPFVLVCTTRPEHGDRWLPVGDHNQLRLRLEPLDRDAALALLREVASDSLTPELEAELIDRSGGNPFFLEELAALVSNEASPELPSTLRGLVQARLDSLLPDERAMVDNASVLGPSGKFGALQRFGTAMGQQATLETFASLAAKGLFVVDGRRWSFRSDAVRDVAYNTLTKADRTQRHVGVAQAAAETADTDPDAVELAAYHLAAAADLIADIGPVRGVIVDVAERAVSWLRRAGAHKLTEDNSRETRRLAERGLGLVADRSSEAGRDLLLLRAWALATEGEPVAARADAEEARQAADAASDSRDLARALTQIGTISQSEGHFDESAALLADAVDLWSKAGDLHGEADARRALGMTEIFRQEFAAAEALLRQARDDYVTLGDRRGQAWVDQHMAWVAFVKGDVSVADERLHSAASTFAELGDAGGTGWALGLLAWVRFQQGRAEEAGALAEFVRREALERGDRWGMAMMLVLLANLKLWAGEIDAAATFAEEAGTHFGAIGNEWGFTQALVPLVRARAAQGRSRDAMRLLEVSRAKASSVGMTGLAAVLGAATYVHLGDARRAIAEGLNCEVPDDPAEIGGYEWRVTMALARLQDGSVEDALKLLDEALSVDGRGEAYARCAHALVSAASGATDDALADAERVRTSPDATYLDRLIADLSTAFVAVQRREGAEARRWFDEACAGVDRTGDLVAQAWARLARAEGLAVVGADDAPGARRLADAHLEALGLTAEGWTLAFQLASSGGGARVRLDASIKR